jgi:hypothetical protein
MQLAVTGSLFAQSFSCEFDFELRVHVGSFSVFLSTRNTLFRSS